MATEQMTAHTPATVVALLDREPPGLGVQHCTLGPLGSSSNEPFTPGLNAPRPAAAAITPTIAATTATMMARIFHHGSLNGRSPNWPAKGGFGYQAILMPVGTSGPG